MCCKVPVTQTEPGWHPVGLDLFKTAKSFIFETPTSNGIESFAQGVNNGVDVRADVQPPNFCIIGDVYDDVNIFFGNDLHKTAKKLSGSGSTSQNGVMRSSHSNILRSTQGWGPEVGKHGRDEVLKILDVAMGRLSVQEAKDSHRHLFDVSRVFLVTCEIGR